jgi:DNA-directed RNA polymerase sigma subunit (sigma70/sigma32)
MASQRLSLLALIALLVWYAPTAVVSAFGVHQQRPKTMELIGSSSTERGYGQAVDVDISLPTRMSTSTTTTKTLERTPQVPYSIATSLPSAGRRRHDYMVRPKSLHSSSHTLKKYPDLLSKQEEIDFTTSIRNMRGVMRRRDDLLSEGGRSEPTEEQWAEACRLSVSSLRRTMQEGQEARSKLVAANGGLVHSIAKRYYASLKSANKDGILTLQDMVQEGNMGLMEAAERFDPSKGFRFSTYATWWVRQRILKSISEYSRVIRLPAHGKYCVWLDGD